MVASWLVYYNIFFSKFRSWRNGANRRKHKFTLQNKANRELWGSATRTLQKIKSRTLGNQGC